MWREILFIIIFGGLVIVGVYFRVKLETDLREESVEKEMQTYYKHADSLLFKLKVAEHKNDSLRHVSDSLSQVLDSLENKNVETKIIYREKYKNYSNPAIVGNDSISKYIAGRILQWDRYFDSIYSK
jgi:hypothetical protein